MATKTKPAKHTPGPWSLHIGLDYVRIDSADGINDVLPETMGVTEEDARVMAAAPDLVDALKEIANHLYQPFDMARCRGMAQDALKKAGIRA